MNVNPLIISALSSLSLSVTPNTYEGTADEYITFNYADERPALRADDTDLYDETTVQVHYFTRGNPQTNKKAIRRLLRASGFTIISTSEFYESDTKFQHIVVEAWINGVIND
jgi:hypothetical protein